VLKVQMANGDTLTFDLSKADQEQAWRSLEQNPTAQADIRAVGVLHQGMWHVMPTPKKFKQVTYKAWLNWDSKNGQERLASLRVGCQADNISIMMILYYPNGNSPRMVSTIVKRTGRQVFKSGDKHE